MEEYWIWFLKVFIYYILKYVLSYYIGLYLLPVDKYRKTNAKYLIKALT